MRIGADPWSDADNWRVVELYAVERLGPRAIARIMDRTVGSVRNQLTALRKRGRIGPARGRRTPAAVGGRPRLALLGRRCPACKGTGVVWDFGLKDPCDKCDGSGRLDA